MARYVILEHDYPELHWDFMLESLSADGRQVLKTWRLAKAPASRGERIAAVALADHRLFYLDYEGPVRENRGNVTKWDHGEYATLAAQPGQELRVLLKGKHIQGTAVLIRDGTGWTFFMEDEGLLTPTSNLLPPDS
jgi:hypothetical protein